MKRNRVGPGIYKVWSQRVEDWGYKANLRLGERRIWLPTDGVFASDQQARNALKEARAAYARQEFLFAADRQAATIRTIFEAWLDKLNKKKCTLEHIRMAERTFQAFGRQVLDQDSSLDSLTVADLEKYFTLRREQGASAATARKELKQIHGALNNAGSIKGLESWTPPRKPEDLEPGAPEQRRAITQAEQELILLWLKDRGWIDLMDMVVIGIHTGMRAKEILRIDRADIHDEPAPGCQHGILIVRTTKTSRFRLTGKTQNRPTRMSKKVRRILEERRANWNPLTETKTTGPLFPKFNYGYQFESCCEALKIPYGIKTPNGITFHSTRHTFITRQRERGTRLEVVQKLTGQKTSAVTLGYSHVSGSELGDAMAYLDDEQE